jgi:2-oxoglutarate ferredoxin oxidoreductase subunit alpha
MQARYGTHGDYEIIALCPSSVQQTLEQMIRAFNLAEKYRTPVLLLTDAAIGHMRERITVPSHPLVVTRDYVDIDYNDYKPFRTGYMHATKIPEFAPFGTKYNTYVTGLTHNDDGHPITDDWGVHAKLIKRITSKLTDNMDDIYEIETRYLDYAEIAVVSYGISARPALEAVYMAQRLGRDVAYINLTTLWPFNYEFFSDLSKRVDKIVVVEMNIGSIYHSIREASSGRCDVVLVSSLGGRVSAPKDIWEEIK